MVDTIDLAVVDWSRWQFALTAIYHWLFVPLTLGITFIIAIMETLYVRTGKEEWKKITKFWMTLFGINFAIGVSTGIILEFEFGTNWSNYSWFVGDIFGAPLAIEGIMAFFMESTFIAIMFFGWNKVSKKVHLTSTWLTAIGANLSALWILVANAWMQNPVGMRFNPDTARNEMVNFWDVLFSPVAVNKFIHTITSGYVLAAIFVIGISSWFLIRNREIMLSKKSILVAAIFGLVSSLILISSGDGSAYQVAQKQPMKLAAMEGLYNGQQKAGLVAIGIINGKKKYDNEEKEYHMKFEIPHLLSILGYRNAEAFVPGVADIIKGYEGINESGEKIVEPPVEEKIIQGRIAISALGSYRDAVKKNETEMADSSLKVFEENFKYFGYGYLNDPSDVIPNVPLTFYSFHIMVVLGFLFLAFLVVTIVLIIRNTFHKYKWLLWTGLFMIPLAYIASEAGWIVAEVGRQPWVIQDLMPTVAAVSRIDASAIQVTFILFAVIFTLLLIAEIKIMITQIKKGPNH